MSLWKVDDTATLLLMTEFYNKLINGNSKKQSLYKAQQYLRTYQMESMINQNIGRHSSCWMA